MTEFNQSDLLGSKTSEEIADYFGQASTDTDIIVIALASYGSTPGLATHAQIQARALDLASKFSAGTLELVKKE